LNRFRQAHPECSTATLLYLYWEPLNSEDVKECREHDHEIKSFARMVSDSQIKFGSMTYNNLWNEWNAIPDLAAHAQSLKARYEVRIEGDRNGMKLEKS
jgi:hypothetical protein